MSNNFYKKNKCKTINRLLKNYWKLIVINHHALIIKILTDVTEKQGNINELLYT